MKISLILFPGTNREHDMAAALKNAGATDVKMVWHKETGLPETDLIVLPGGFSYGDYLRCGAMAAHSPIMKEIIRKAQNGTRVFGVCNGFQILIETGLLPGALLRNKSLRFICKNVPLNAEAATGYLPQNTRLTVPVAHGEGNYFANDDALKRLQDEDTIAFRYCNDNGDYTNEANANGSSFNIAGVYNKDKTILGMMPHPEDATLPHHGNQSAEDFFKGLLAGV
jgi:phosphoribosylformylglycinamidine synthase